MNQRLRTSFYIALIFASGLLAGATLMNLAEHYWLHKASRTEIDIRRHREIARQMSQRLGLSAAQQQQVNRILKHTVRKYLEVESSIAPQFAMIRSQGRARLRQILNPEQRVRFDRLVQQVDARYPKLERQPEIPADSTSPGCRPNPR